MKSLRYTLRSLVAAVMLFASGEALYCHWSPWDRDTNLAFEKTIGWESNYSPDMHKVIRPATDMNGALIYSWHENRIVAELRVPNSEGQVYYAVFSPDGLFALTLSDELAGSRTGNKPNRYHAQVWRRYRPEYWWGVLWLKEFWATVFFAAFFAWSIWRDRKYFKVIDARFAAKLAAKAAGRSESQAT